MVIQTNLSYRFFILIVFLFTLANPKSDSDLKNELVSLRSTAESGVISFNNDDVSKFITSVSTPRPYSLIIFFDAVHLHGNSFVGFLYTVVGLLLAFVTNVVVRVKKLDEQRMAMLLALSISFWAVRKVVYLDNWKTGYEIYPYWPSSWRG